MRTDYKVCPMCGAVLDVGETCECNKRIYLTDIDGSRCYSEDTEDIKILIKDNRTFEEDLTDTDTEECSEVAL